MKKRDLEHKIHRAFSNATPDVWETIQDDCNMQKGTVLEMKAETAKKNFVKPMLAIAAAIVLLLSGFGFYAFYSVQKTPIANISLDVNPSVSLRVNKKDRVIDATAQNADGEKILSNLDLQNTTLDTAVNALIGSMVQNGYLSDLSNSILISVDGKDTASAEALQAKVSTLIDTYMQESFGESAVLSQELSEANPRAAEFAQQYGISVGKAQFILDLVAANPRYQAEDLVGMTVNELNVLAQSTENSLGNIESSGTASTKAYIGKDRAISAALAKAGVSAEQAKRIEADLEAEKINGQMTMIYDVEFQAGDTEFDVAVDAVTGAVLQITTEPVDRPEKPDAAEKEEPDDDLPEENEDCEPEKPDSDDQIPEGKYIGDEAAKAAALKHAGFTAGEVRNLTCKAENENGTVLYDVEFRVGDLEYDYAVAANDGRVLHHHKELDQD